MVATLQDTLCSKNNTHGPLSFAHTQGYFTSQRQRNCGFFNSYTAQKPKGSHIEAKYLVTAVEEAGAVFFRDVR